jgi:ubiquitin carboxyl-terminal hydrolase 8
LKKKKTGFILTCHHSVTSRKIEESLVLAWESEQIYFVNRHKFDLVVYYDQSSTNISLSLNEPLRNLKAAIYENEFSKMLQRVPVMLVGGFDAWVKQIGSKGVHVFPPTTKQPQTSQPSPSKDQENIPPRNHEKQLWLKNVVGKTEDVYGNNDSINRTVMDYVRAVPTTARRNAIFSCFNLCFFFSLISRVTVAMHSPW